MGNAIVPCFRPRTLKSSSSSSSSSAIRLVFWEGTTRLLAGRHVAGEIMFEFPDKMVCHADSFFIGHPVPALSIDDELSSGQTYFVLPIDSFACKALNASSLAALGSCPDKSPMKFGENPFQYVKGANGRVVIKVTPEFIMRLISRSCNDDDRRESVDEGSASPTGGYLCSTPELQKHYDQLVGTREQIWSPKLETISEYKVRFSPCKFIRVGVKEEGGY